MKQAEVFFDAITGIRPELVDEALDHRFARQRIRWQRYAGVAASLVLCALIGFGALRTGILSSSNMDNASDTVANGSAAPESWPGDSKADSSTAVSGDTADGSESESADVDAGSAYKSENVTGVFDDSLSRFTATVLEIGDGWLLVEPAEGEEILASSDRFTVSVAAVEDLPELKEGDGVVITFAGMIRESYPAQIDAVSIEPSQVQP